MCDCYGCVPYQGILLVVVVVVVGETVDILTMTEKTIWDALTMPCNHAVCSHDHNISVLMMITSYSVLTAVTVVMSFAASLSFSSI